jgi:hypothetical protein
MELSEKQAKDLLNDLNWEIDDPTYHFSFQRFKEILDGQDITVKEADE